MPLPIAHCRLPIRVVGLMIGQFPTATLLILTRLQPGVTDLTEWKPFQRFLVMRADFRNR